MPSVADFASIQPDLHRLHPTDVLDEIDVNELDTHLPRLRLLALLHEVGRVQGANAVLETEIVRSHILHVGCGDAPDWERFNREMSRRKRVSILQRLGGGILYWNLRFSRIGPFWTDNWNMFQVRGDVVVPEVVDPPDRGTWTTIINRIRQILADYEFREIPPALLRSRIPWLRYSGDRTALDDIPDEHSTVYDALFSDFC